LANKRISKDEYYLQIARAVASRSTCLRRRYGAIIVKEDQIVATGYNGAPRGRENCIDLGKCFREENLIPPGSNYELCRAVHAEMNAILQAGRKNTIGGTLYLYGEEVTSGKATERWHPCIICARLIINAGISRIVTLDRGKVTEIYPQQLQIVVTPPDEKI